MSDSETEEGSIEKIINKIRKRLAGMGVHLREEVAKLRGEIENIKQLITPQTDEFERRFQQYEDRTNSKLTGHVNVLQNLINEKERERRERFENEIQQMREEFERRVIGGGQQRENKCEDRPRKENWFQERAGKTQVKEETNGEEFERPPTQFSDLEAENQLFSYLAKLQNQIDTIEGAEKKKRNHQELGHRASAVKDALECLPSFSVEKTSIPQYIRSCSRVYEKLTLSEQQEFLEKLRQKFKGMARYTVDTIEFKNLRELETSLNENFSPYQTISQVRSAIEGMSKRPKEDILEYINRTESLYLDLVHRAENENSGLTPAERRNMETQTIEAFLEGMPIITRTVCELRPHSTLQEAFKNAIRVHRKLALEESRNNNSSVAAVRVISENASEAADENKKNKQNNKNKVTETKKEEVDTKAVNKEANTLPINVQHPWRTYGQRNGLQGINGNQGQQSVYQTQRSRGPYNTPYQGQNNTEQPRYFQPQNYYANYTTEDPGCGYCNFKGHDIGNCRKLQSLIRARSELIAQKNANCPGGQGHNMPPGHGTAEQNQIGPNTQNNQ